ncbi:hypothetical protein DERF_006390 [Dermatophagoides farinae]|uniref:Uncharacterized protein n=1 Tax=Dermatophagoides farinae TaxID=6954 RepID=A0A922I5D0_DERFA|nr:hypothetical protein DERF_006390 [Dermatophagoides farinae]
MQEINDFYRYSMTIDNYKISTNDFTRDILVTVFDKQNCFRIERGKKHRYNGNAISRYMTKVKLVLDNEEKTDRIAREWSLYHQNANFFSIHSNDDNLHVHYERPWIGSFEWTDNCGENLQIVMSIKWHLSSFQFCRFNDPKNDDDKISSRNLKCRPLECTHTYHRTLHIIFETYYFGACGSLSLIDRCSADILILYFNSSVIYDLKRGFFDPFCQKNQLYKFKTFDSNFCQYNYDGTSKLSSMLALYSSTKLEKIPQSHNAFDFNENHYADSVNMINAQFTTRIITGVESRRCLNSKDTIIADYVHTPNEGIELEFETVFLQYQEIIEIVIEIEICDKQFNRMNIKNDVYKYLATHPEERSKFLQILPNRTRFNDQLIDYTQMNCDPFVVSLLYVPSGKIMNSNNMEKIYATIGFTCTKADLRRIFDNARNGRYNFNYHNNNNNTVSSIEFKNEKQQPLELTIHVTYKSFQFGSILSEQFKKIAKHESGFLLFDAIIEDRLFVHASNVLPLESKKSQSINHHQNDNTDQLKVFKTDLIFHVKNKIEHHLMLDGVRIKLENSNQFIVKQKNHLFRLDIGTNYTCKKNPNSDILQFTHYPNFKLIRNCVKKSKIENDESLIVKSNCPLEKESSFEQQQEDQYHSYSNHINNHDDDDDDDTDNDDYDQQQLLMNDSNTVSSTTIETPPITTTKIVKKVLTSNNCIQQQQQHKMVDIRARKLRIDKPNSLITLKQYPCGIVDDNKSEELSNDRPNTQLIDTNSIGQKRRRQRSSSLSSSPSITEREDSDD